MSGAALGGSINDFQSLHLDAEEFSELIDDHGIDIEYRQAVWCPCSRVESRNPRSGCPHCRGTRFVYPTDLRNTEAKALVQNRFPKRDRVPVGELITGTAVMVFPLGIVPAIGDMVLPCEEYHVVHEQFWRSYQPIDNAEIRELALTDDQHPPTIVPRAEKLLYPEIVEVEFVYWEDRERKKLCKASSTDYQLVGREIRWKGSRGPKAGEGYSIRYLAPAAYILNPAEPFWRQENGGQGLPYRVEAQRLDIWGDPSLRGDT